MEHKRNILIGCTGSVAAIKLPVVLNLMKKRNQNFLVSSSTASMLLSKQQSSKILHSFSPKVDEKKKTFYKLLKFPSNFPDKSRPDRESETLCQHQ
jgi:phosphopantothenoylcysteine synthetase/decarboxylase